MSSGSRFEINSDALVELMLSPQMENALWPYADGFEGDKRAWRSHDRVAIQVYSGDKGNDNNEMLKELFSGGKDAN